MIDLHSHVLPGLDDGCRSLEDSLELADAALADGVTVLAGTPHVRDDFPTTPEAMEAALARLREALAARRLPLEVLPGGEIAWTRLDRLSHGELARFGLGGNPSLLLLELPTSGWPLALAPRLRELRGAGFRVVVAHPERHADLRGRPDRLRELAGAGALFQVTSAALDGRLGRTQRAAALELVDLGFAHLLASDAHGRGVRASGMRAAAAALRDEPLARWLTEDVPAALLAGAELPPRPPRARRRLAGLLRR